MSSSRPAKDRPDPETVPPEARHSARGLERWLEDRRNRGVPPEGYKARCSEGCILHDHDE